MDDGCKQALAQLPRRAFDQRIASDTEFAAEAKRTAHWLTSVLGIGALECDRFGRRHRRRSDLPARTRPGCVAWIGASTGPLAEGLACMASPSAAAGSCARADPGCSCRLANVASSGTGLAKYMIPLEILRLFSGFWPGRSIRLRGLTLVI
jgi:hypothetical protein